MNSLKERVKTDRNRLLEGRDEFEVFVALVYGDGIPARKFAVAVGILKRSYELFGDRFSFTEVMAGVRPLTALAGRFWTKS
jgi:hypothetical protein